MKTQITPNTTLFPVAVVLVSCRDAEGDNLITINRAASINAEPPMIGIAIRPGRASHEIITRSGEFGINIPLASQQDIVDYIGVTTRAKTDKWADCGLTKMASSSIAAPLVANCPINLECIVRETVSLPSHTFFIGEVMNLHADKIMLNEKNEIEFDLATTGLIYNSSAVRERPTQQASPEKLLERIKNQK